MSTVKTNNVQIGQSLTATNNGTWYQPATPDGTVRLGVGNAGATSSDILIANSSGNLGLGVTPSASSTKTFEIGNVGNVVTTTGSNEIQVAAGAYYNAGWKYAVTGSPITNYYQSGGVHYWRLAASGTAENAISFTQAMTLSAAGGLSVGTTIDAGAGNIRAANSIYVGDGSVSNNAIARAAGTGTGFYFPAANTIGFTTSAIERARIDSSGNLLVGTTSTDPAGSNVTGAAIKSGAACSIQNGSTTALALGSSANNTYLQVFRNAGTLAGYISVPTANTTTYNSVSDQRLKENIVDAPSAIDSINAIKVRSFDWKIDGVHVDYGWIAQELLEVAPEAVSASDDPEEMMGVDFGRLTPRLVKAIQELHQEIQELKQKVNA